MAYKNRQSRQELQLTKPDMNRVVTQPFADQRTSTNVQLKQQKIMQARNSDQPPVQRNINSNHFEKSNDIDPSYVIDPGSRAILYSTTTAPAPVPEALYTKNADHDDGANRAVFSWTPNVRLLDDEEKEDFKDRGDDEKARIVQIFKNVIESQHDGAALQNPTIGIMGKNDCAAFATALYNIIARDKFRRTSGVKQLTETIVNYTQQYPDMDVGDMMRHVFDTQLGEQGGCGWHAATVVAKQDEKLVTLEANVSKSLQVPEFYIRAGSTGFVDDNKESGEQGDKLDVIKYQHGDAPTDDLNRYMSVNQIPNLMLGNVVTHEPLDPYHQAIQRDIVALLTQPNCVEFWHQQSVLEGSMPDGIIAMRAVIGNVNSAVAIGASKGSGSKSLTRSGHTHYFYQLMHRYFNFCQNPSTPQELKSIYAAVTSFPVR